VTQRNVLAVVLWMIGTLLSFSAAAVGVRALSKTLSMFEILARATFRARRLPLHFLRKTAPFSYAALPGSSGVFSGQHGEPQTAAASHLQLRPRRSHQRRARQRRL
jgi:hypothetical protein